MLFYWFLLGIVLSFTLIAQILKNKKYCRFTVITLFLVFFLLSAFRVDIGVDYIGYERIYRVYQTGYGQTFAKEPFFVLLNVLAVKLDLGFYFVIAITSLLTLLPICYIAYKEATPLLMCVYYIFLYSMSFSLVRQFIAMSFALLCTYLMIRGRNQKLQLFFAVVAIGFHISIIIYLVVLFFSRFIHFDMKYTLFVSAAIMILFMLFRSTIVSHIQVLVDSTKYGRYFSAESTHNHKISISSGWGVCLRYFIYVCYLVTANILVKEKKTLETFNVFFIVLIVADLFAMNVEIMIRFKIMLFITLLIPLIDFKKIHAHEVPSYILKLGLVTMPIAYLIVMKYENDIIGWKNVPYQTWLF